MPDTNATPETVQMQVRLPRDVVEAVDSIAESRMVGRSLIVARALSDFLDRLLPVEAATDADSIREALAEEDG